MSDFTFAEKAFEQYLYWQNNDKQILQKINQLLRSIDREGALAGLGKPEKLRRRAGAYSRRIDRVHRLVYCVEPGRIVILSCRGHYDG